jgi:putative selenium metabolism protein SsnA
VTEIALAGGTVVTSLDPPAVVSGDVLVKDGRITGVGTAPEGMARRDCSGCLIIPGNVCAHTHLYSSMARGMPYRLEPPTSFLQILQRVWWRLDRALDESSIRASALLGGMEALLSGTTTVVDHHASPNAIDGSLDIVADALEELGIRSILCYEVTERDGYERALAGLEENRRFLTRRQRVPFGRPALTRGMVGAHASFTLSDETLKACAEVAREQRTGVHVHVAEDAADERDAHARSGVGAAERLLGAGVPPADSLFAHCVHVDAPAAALLREAGVTVAHNARSNMNNRVGRAPVRSLGPRVALGTDGIGAGMFAESRAAYFRLREEDASVGAAWALERLASGARFAGPAFGEPGLGRIEPGGPADAVVLEYSPPVPLSAESFSGHWIFGLGARHVRDVLVAGEVVVQDRRVTRVDQGKVLAEAMTEATALWERLDDLPAHPFEPGGGA